MLGRNAGMGSAVTATPTLVASPGSRAEGAPGALTDVPPGAQLGQGTRGPPEAHPPGAGGPRRP